MPNPEVKMDDFDQEATAETDEKTPIREKFHDAVAKITLKIKRLLLP